MKNYVKRFGQSINEMDGHMNMGQRHGSHDSSEYSVILDFVLTEELVNISNVFSDLAQIAPNCRVADVEDVGNYFDLIVVGPKSECQAIADHWSNMGGEPDSTYMPVEPYTPRNRY